MQKFTIFLLMAFVCGGAAAGNFNDIRSRRAGDIVFKTDANEYHNDGLAVFECDDDAGDVGNGVYLYYLVGPGSSAQIAAKRCVITRTGDYFVEDTVVWCADKTKCPAGYYSETLGQRKLCAKNSLRKIGDVVFSQPSDLACVIETVSAPLPTPVTPVVEPVVEKIAPKIVKPTPVVQEVRSENPPEIETVVNTEVIQLPVISKVEPIAVVVDTSIAKKRIENAVSGINLLELNETVWRTAEGKFNTSRLVSDSVAGVVLGTAGGLITSNIIKKNQVENGFEDISCTVGGQVVAAWDDEFRVGVR